VTQRVARGLAARNLHCARAHVGGQRALGDHFAPRNELARGPELQRGARPPQLPHEACSAQRRVAGDTRVQTPLESSGPCLAPLCPEPRSRARAPHLARAEEALDFARLNFVPHGEVVLVRVAQLGHKAPAAPQHSITHKPIRPCCPVGWQERCAHPACGWELWAQDCSGWV
jgi:hypothetical protein